MADPGRGWRVDAAAFTVEHVQLTECRVAGDVETPCAAWLSRIASIQRVPPPVTRRGGRQRVLGVDAPLTQALVSTDAHDDTSATLEAHATYESVDVVFTVLGETTSLGPMLDGIYRVAQAYRTSVRSAQHVRPNEFRTRYGAVELADPRMEETYVRLVHTASSAQLELASQVVAVSTTDSMLDAWQRTLADVSDLSRSVEVRRQGPRSVAGLPGEELVFAAVEAGRLRVFSTWAYAGEAFATRRPRLWVQHEAPADDRNGHGDTWDRVLDSLRIVS